MELKRISDQDLLYNTKLLVQKEQALGMEIIAHLEEIDRRKLYADLKHPSLWEYCVNELGYSRSQAYRRIDAMRMARSVPEVKTALTTGQLNITTVNLASEFFRGAEICDIKSKRKLLTEICGKSKKQVEAHLLKKKEELGLDLFSPRKEVIKEVSAQEVRLHLTLKKSTVDKMNRLKGLLAHQNANLSTEELLNDVLDEAIAKTEKKKFAKVETTEGKTIKQTQHKNPRYIPATIKRQIYDRAATRCQNCQSLFALEIDHLQALGKGGGSDVNNLRLLCRSCNARSAIKDYGLDFMEKYFRSPSVSKSKPKTLLQLSSYEKREDCSTDNP